MPSFWSRRVFEKAVEQQLHAEIVDGAAEKNRRGLVGQHGGVIPVVPGVFEHFEFFHGPAKRFVVEPAPNRRIVQSPDLHRRAILAADGAFEQMHQLRLPVIDALKFEAVADGPVHRKRADAEHALQFIDQRQRVLHRAVTFVHEREDRHAALAADLEELARLRLDALGRINHHHHRIHGREHAVGVLGKILVPRRVEQVEAVAVVIELKDRGADGDAAFLFQLHPVGRGGALVFAGGNRAGELHGATIKQQLLRERGLARVRMRDDGERAPLLNFFRNAHKSREEYQRISRKQVLDFVSRNPF